MNEVSEEKIQAVAQSALNQTRSTLNMLARDLMTKKGLRPDQIEIVQENTPLGIKMYVREKKDV